MSYVVAVSLLLSWLLVVRCLSFVVGCSLLIVVVVVGVHVGLVFVFCC